MRGNKINKYFKFKTFTIIFIVLAFFCLPTVVRPKSEIRQIPPTKLRKFCLNACSKTVFGVVKLSQRLIWINLIRDS